MLKKETDRLSAEIKTIDQLRSAILKYCKHKDADIDAAARLLGEIYFSRGKKNDMLKLYNSGNNPRQPT